MQKKERTLNELIELMKELDRRGIQVHIEGRGDTTIELVYDNVFILPNYKTIWKNSKKN